MQIITTTRIIIIISNYKKKMQRERESRERITAKERESMHPPLCKEID